ncbi:hypothetical protein NDU88_002153 [Pleurodeles waltl]|uniref:Uncharacterized protein n=1 Tax=Pleurodeles waltl TaxID=8319 RepID=A0AAV7TKU5_PLEWA|nr:hypothetical protein NDU88_002153 [Pleurodeles waltl]
MPWSGRLRSSRDCTTGSERRAALQTAARSPKVLHAKSQRGRRLPTATPTPALSPLRRLKPSQAAASSLPVSHRQGPAVHQPPGGGQAPGPELSM